MGLCTTMLKNCKRVAEQLMDCTSIYKERAVVLGISRIGGIFLIVGEG